MRLVYVLMTTATFDPPSRSPPQFPRLPVTVLMQVGWDMPGYPAGSWPAAVLASAPGASTIMSAQFFPEVAVQAILNPRSVEEPSPGVFVYDFGQNFAGYVRLFLPAPVAANQTLTLRHAELLQHPPYGPQDGNIYVGNLRSAKATDVYITREVDSGVLVLEPMFTYHGFRYLEISGLATPLDTSQIEGLFFRSSVIPTGDISFPESANTLNQLQHAITWGQGCNLMSVPSDCPQRDERKGWMGDSGLTNEEASLNYDMCAFYTAWAINMQDAQTATQYSHPTGALPDTVPWTFGGDPGERARVHRVAAVRAIVTSTRAGDPAWETAYLGAIYALWKHCGDTRVPAAHYSNIQV